MIAGTILAAVLVTTAIDGTHAPELHGEIFAGSRWYPEDASPGRDFEWDLGTELEARWNPGRDVALLLRPRLLVDPLDPGRFRWVPTEAWVEARRGAWRLRLGRQVFGWGAADFFNPTDVVSTPDWGLDFADPAKPGDWAVDAVRGSRRWGLEVVWLPALEGVDFPSARSPWSLESAARRGLGFDPGGVHLIEDPRLPPGTSEQSVAARLRWTAGRTDLYAVAYTGVDRSPVLTAVEAPGANIAGLRPAATYLPLHLVGLEVQRAVGDVLLKGALTARDQSVDDAAFAAEVFGEFGLADRSLQGVVGLGYLWFDVLGTPGSLDLNVEFIFDEAPNDDNLAFYRPFQRDIAVGVAWLLNDFSDTVVEAGWVQDLERAESAGTLRVRRRIARGVTAELGGDLILGPPDPLSPFRLFAPNDRLRFRLAYGF